MTVLMPPVVRMTMMMMMMLVVVVVVVLTMTTNRPPRSGRERCVMAKPLLRRSFNLSEELQFCSALGLLA